MKNTIQNGGGKFEYLAPEVTILDISVEAGFAVSNETMTDDTEINPWNA